MISAKKILIIKLRAIGDVILATPIIENLRRAYPDAEIEFLTERPCYPAIKEHPELDNVIVYNRAYIQSLSKRRAFLQNFSFLRSLRKKKYDIVFDLFGNPRSALFALATGARYRVGFGFRGRKFAYNTVVPPRGDRIHEVLFNLDVLPAMGIPVTTTRPEVYIDEVSKAFAEAFWARHGLDGAITVGLNPSGGWQSKRWPLAHFAALGDRIAERLHARVLLLWGPGEKRDAEAVAARMQHDALLAPQADLLQLAALLERLTLLVSNDSGPMHLAAAAGTPVIGIYGPTRPELQGPWGEQHAVVQKSGLDCLGCNGVTCKIKTHECMRMLQPDTVFAQVEQLLAQPEKLRSVPRADSPLR